MMKKIVSLLTAAVMATTIMTTPALATERLPSANGVYEISAFNAELNRDVRIGIKDKGQFTKGGHSINNFDVLIDGVLDYSMQVDVDADKAILRYSDGRVEELTISDTVTLTKVADITSPVVEEGESAFSLRSSFVDNEPFEISASGTQLKLGTTVYSGYEAMGYRTYASPTESGYLQRKNSGYTTFDTYKFTITKGTSFGTAVGIIASVVISSLGGPLSAAIAGALLTGILGGAASVIVDAIDGTVRCRKYKWDYRVRHNSNTGTILKSTFRTRYWWEMYDKKGNRSFEPRNDVVGEGWVLSNSELIANALGR